MAFQSVWGFFSPSSPALFGSVEGRVGNHSYFSLLIAPIRAAPWCVHLLRNSLLLPVLRCSRGFWRRSGAAGGGEEVALGSAASVPADHPCSDPDAVRASLPPWSVWLLCCSSRHSVMQSPRKC